MMQVGTVEMTILMVHGVDLVAGTTSKRIHRGVVPPNLEKDQNPVAANQANPTASLESLTDQAVEAATIKTDGMAATIQVKVIGVDLKDGGMEKALHPRTNRENQPHRPGSLVNHRESQVNQQESLVNHPESQARALAVMEDGTIAAGRMEGTILALSRHPSRSQFHSQNQLMCPPQSPR